VAVVVPTEALAEQWRRVIPEFTNLSEHEVGLLGAGGHDSLDDKRALVAVLNTAARDLPGMVAGVKGPTMFIVDECHRAGAPSFSQVLRTTSVYRLGLSATPDREDLDDDGEPLEYDEQLVGRALGPVVFKFSLKEARSVGWLPEFTVHHHGIALLPEEHLDYDRMSRQVDDLGDRLADLGGDAARARVLAAQPGELGRVAGAYVAAVARRKDLLYRARERNRVTRSLMKERFSERPDSRALTFHERIAEARELHELLNDALPVRVGIDHSQLPPSERRSTLDAFRSGKIKVLVSVKSLIEGIDVPSADIGVSVASSSSVRQRVQSLGRVLRRSFDSREKVTEMHVVYVRDTVDEVIYAKDDWTDLTGQASNVYWEWPTDPNVPPVQLAGPPRTPAPTEEQEWERLGRASPPTPAPYLGTAPAREYSVDTSGTVRTRPGAIIANPQGVADMVNSVRGRPGGRFFVTPTYKLVLVREAAQDGRLMVAGQLREPFSIRSLDQEQAAPDVERLIPGAPYTGPLDKTNGEYRLSQKRGGVVQRDLPSGAKEFALSEGEPGASNVSAVLSAWRAVSTSGMKFTVNREWHAWYLAGGEPRFLAAVPGGFSWPSRTSEAADG
jgi:superfamily II DNA or RNA helicase